MAALDRVLALARSYERAEGGHLERVRAYARGPEMATDTDHWLISGLALDLRNHLDPEMFEKLYRIGRRLTKAEAMDIQDQLTAYKRKVMAAR